MPSTRELAHLPQNLHTPAAGLRMPSFDGGALRERRRAAVDDPSPVGPVAPGTFLSEDPQMRRIKELAERVAPTSVPVLITGESGVGKEVLARFIHARSDRARGPFVKINCAAVPHDLLESEMFGHERGAFTGAHQRTEGKFELAQGGTILLDEIGEMDLALQAKFLHVLEDATFTRVGGNQPVKMQARVLATTNRPLEEAMAEGSFRKDLFFRLNVIRIQIPALRDRTADITLLAEHLLRSSRENSSVACLPDELVAGFLRHDWPGNVRELKHVIQRYVIMPDVEMVLAELVTSARPPPPTPAPAMSLQEVPSAAPTGGMKSGLADVVLENGKIPTKSIGARAAEEATKRVVLEVLREERWNRRRAAARMDVCYKTLLNMLDRWDLRLQEAAGPLARLDEDAAPAI